MRGGRHLGLVGRKHLFVWCCRYHTVARMLSVLG